MKTASGFRRLAERLIYTERGQIISSLLMGFALALLFRKACDAQSCRVIVAPPVKDIQSKIFKLEDACYVYTPEAIKCPEGDNPKIIPSEVNDGAAASA
jgi:hypothetical protein